MDGEAVRITCWPAPERRIVLLTVFRKTKQREDIEVARARLAQRVCEADHGRAAHRYDRNDEDRP